MTTVAAAVAAAPAAYAEKGRASDGKWARRYEAFTDDVIAAVTRPGDAKHHQYALRGREAHVIHSVGPDLRKNSPSRAEALFVLTR